MKTAVSAILIVSLFALPVGITPDPSCDYQVPKYNQSDDKYSPSPDDHQRPVRMDTTPSYNIHFDVAQVLPIFQNGMLQFDMTVCR